jgi:hypothetical protein
MPGKIRSKAQAAFLAIHSPGVLHELSGGSIPNFKSLPQHVGKRAMKGTFIPLRKRGR